MVYLWCTACQSRSCSSDSSHRAQGYLGYRADFMVGGRYGKRIRKLFPTAKDAHAFEHITLADYKRGLFLPQQKSKVTFEDFFVEYVDKYVNRYMRGAEVECYRLKHWKEMFKSRSLASINSQSGEDYVSTRLKKGVGQTTINREITSLKSMFTWAVNNGFLSKNPLEKIRKFKVEGKRVRWLSEIELEAILSKCTQVGDLALRDIFVVAANTGFRKANLMQLTANDIQNNRIQAVRTKSNKPYDVPINQILASVLNRLVRAKPSGPLLDFRNERQRIDLVLTDPTVTLHTFRHTFAAQCLKAGVPIDRVSKWMGHHSLNFTMQHYGHLCPNQEHIEINLLNLGKRVVSPSNEITSL